mgnify:CR=1 FL=1
MNMITFKCALLLVISTAVAMVVTELVVDLEQIQLQLGLDKMNSPHWFSKTSWGTAMFTNTETTAAASANNNESPPPKLSDIQLFVSSYMKGFWELENTCLRSLDFFWPRDEPLNLVVVMDDTECDHNETKKQEIITRITSAVHHPMANVTVAFNPRSDKSLYGGDG